MTYELKFDKFGFLESFKRTRRTRDRIYEYSI